MKKMMLALVAGVVALCATTVQAQDTASYKLRLSLSLLDVPQQNDLPYKYPSMQQSVELSNNLYDLGYRGIDLLGDKLINPQRGSRFLNKASKYLLSLAFVKYGSELPVPLGIWAHEEYHRTVLGVNGIRAENGNWLLSRWDGTVYGVSDAEMTNLKQNRPQDLLYAYTAGVHAEVLSTQTNLVQDVYYKRSIYKNALYLYNAWYIWDYLSFANSDITNTVKRDVPQYESKNPLERDFAGNDFTAWAYDMFNPNLAYTSRDAFPNGEGVNRRVGTDDLQPEARDFLKKQKKLALINFINPAIFFVNRINLNEQLAFNFFGQYVPTHFGNNISLQLPVRYKNNNLLLGFHSYNNRNQTTPGVTIGIIDKALGSSGKFSSSLLLHSWLQPENQSYFAEKSEAGGSAEVGVKYHFSPTLATFAQVAGKTAGWQLGNPYLDNNMSLRLGLSYNLRN